MMKSLVEGLHECEQAMSGPWGEAGAGGEDHENRGRV